MSYTFPDGNAASDVISGEHHPSIKIEYGAHGQATFVSPINPMPVREPVFSAQLGSGGVSSTTTSSAFVSANASRTLLEIWNSSPVSGVWLRLATLSATAGMGPFIPPYGYWAAPYTGYVTVKADATTSLVSYVER